MGFSFVLSKGQSFGFVPLGLGFVPMSGHYALPDRWSYAYGERETVGGGAAAGPTRLVLYSL